MDKIREIWNEWEIVGLIGEGAFGKVYKVKKQLMGTNTYAAVKIMHIPQTETEIRDLQHSGMDFHSIHSYYNDMVKNLLNEIQIMVALKSASNIVAIEDYKVLTTEDEIGWDIYIKMELLTDLGTWMNTHEMTENEIVKLGMDICQALTACQKVHIIHRDIKIDNVFVNQFDDFKLGDFGISKQLEKTQSAVSQKGTNMYMAPEVFRGEHYDQTVDIYSLGILLYRLLNAGRFPFMPTEGQLRYNDQQIAMQRRLRGENIPPISGSPKALSDIVIKACSYQSVDRYSSAREMYNALYNYRNGIPPEHLEKSTGQEKIWKETVLRKEQWNRSFCADDEEKTQAVFHHTASGRTAAVHVPARSEKNVYAASALALFFGPFGAQNWYLGRKKLAGCALLISVISFFLLAITETEAIIELACVLMVIPIAWGMVDAVVLLFGVRKDSTGARVCYRLKDQSGDFGKGGVKSKRKAFWLAFLLGGFGAHHFYLGNKKFAWLAFVLGVSGSALLRAERYEESISSIGMLGFVLVCGVRLWNLIDAVIIAMGKGKDSTGTPLI